MHFFALSEAKLEKILKKIAEKFGGKEKSRTFAARLRNNGIKSSLKRLKESTRSKYREYNKIYREALISLEIIMMNYHDRVKPIARLAQDLEMRNIIKCQDKLRNL